MTPTSVLPTEVDASPDSAGYEIAIVVNADGTFGVKGPRPLAPEGPEETGGDPMAGNESYPDIASALKGALAIYQENPVAGEQTSFEAGFGPKEKPPVESKKPPMMGRYQ